MNLISKAREKLNNKAYDLGNRITPQIKERAGVGLGDLLTVNVNFRRAGAVIGAATPTAAFYSLARIFNPSDFAIADMVIPLMTNAIYPIPAVCGSIGYAIGEKLDSLIGDKSPRIFNYESYRRNRFLNSQESL